MSRGCPPHLRDQRDWEALPKHLRSLIGECRDAAALIPGGISVGGRRGQVVFSRNGRSMAIDEAHIVLGGLSMAEVAVLAGRRLGAI